MEGEDVKSQQEKLLRSAAEMVVQTRRLIVMLSNTCDQAHQLNMLTRRSIEDSKQLLHVGGSKLPVVEN